eukprot:m.173496 g.173496  ORF g.173496 m.173496 type:complete len:73 (+) comp31726_c2_seq5:906-1124(+)
MQTMAFVFLRMQTCIRSTLQCDHIGVSMFGIENYLLVSVATCISIHIESFDGSCVLNVCINRWNKNVTNCCN